jgi:hypothetical protein
VTQLGWMQADANMANPGLYKLPVGRASVPLAERTRTQAGGWGAPGGAHSYGTGIALVSSKDCALPFDLLHAQAEVERVSRVCAHWLREKESRGADETPPDGLASLMELLEIKSRDRATQVRVLLSANHEMLASRLAERGATEARVHELVETRRKFSEKFENARKALPVPPPGRSFKHCEAPSLTVPTLEDLARPSGNMLSTPVRPFVEWTALGDGTHPAIFCRVYARDTVYVRVYDALRYLAPYPGKIELGTVLELARVWAAKYGSSERPEDVLLEDPELNKAAKFEASVRFMRAAWIPRLAAVCRAENLAPLAARTKAREAPVGGEPESSAAPPRPPKAKTPKTFTPGDFRELFLSPPPGVPKPPPFPTRPASSAATAPPPAAPLQVAAAPLPPDDPAPIVPLATTPSLKRPAPEDAPPEPKRPAPETVRRTGRVRRPPTML